jgi:hypothetical protein
MQYGLLKELRNPRKPAWILAFSRFCAFPCRTVFWLGLLPKKVPVSTKATRFSQHICRPFKVVI